MTKTNNNKGPKKNQQRTKQTATPSSSALQATSKSGGRSQTGVTRREQNAAESPFATLRRFGEEMDRIFEDFGFGGVRLAPTVASGLDRLRSIGNEMWTPQVEIIERDNQLVVRADLPGMTKDNVNVEIAGDALVIRGERKDEREEEDKGYYRSERSYGSFYRTVPLPQGINIEDATADFRNGVLEITMPAPQRVEQKQRQLEIRERTEAEEKPKSKSKAAGQT